MGRLTQILYKPSNISSTQVYAISSTESIETLGLKLLDLNNIAKVDYFFNQNQGNRYTISDDIYKELIKHSDLSAPVFFFEGNEWMVSQDGETMKLTKRMLQIVHEQMSDTSKQIEVLSRTLTKLSAIAISIGAMDTQREGFEQNDSEEDIERG